MTNPELSVWTSYYIDLSPEDAVLELKKLGFNAALDLLQKLGMTEDAENAGNETVTVDPF